VVGTGPIDVTELVVLRGAAIQIRQGLAKQLLIAPGTILFFSGQTASRGITSVLDVLIIFAVLVMAGLYAFSALQFRRTGTFLTANGPVPLP
jgi:hypothetical protein